MSTLDDFDWCLQKLETVHSAKSVGNMAQDKFKRLLSRELSHMSERSRSGQFVAEWVNTITGNAQGIVRIHVHVHVLLSEFLASNFL